jgi:hypothetical protein
MNASFYVMKHQRKKANVPERQKNAKQRYLGTARLPEIIVMSGLIFIVVAVAVGNPLHSSPVNSSPNNSTSPDLQPTMAPNVHASLQMFTFNPLISPPPNPTFTPQSGTPVSGGTSSGTGNNDEIITVTTTLSGFGFHVTLTLHYPKNGGQLTGTASGDCNGPISGKYKGLPSGAISGTAMANCSTLGGFISTQGSMTFTGNINSTNTQVTLNYNATLSGMNFTGSDMLPLKQQ